MDAPDMPAPVQLSRIADVWRKIRESGHLKRRTPS